MKRAALLLCLMLLPILTTQAQSPNRYGWVYGAFPTGYGWVVPRVSPTAIVSQVVGVTDVMIRYSRPAVRERTIWGDLVPYDQVWRAGANEATVISFSTDVRVEGQPLPAGTYALFTLPGRDSWTLIFSNRPQQWGAFSYSDAEDVLRVSVTPEPAEHMERLQYSIPVVTDSTAQVVLHWERLKVPFTISTDVHDEAQALAANSFDWRAGFFAADYFFNQDTHLEDALHWANASIALNENASNLLLKARILGRLERFEEAISAAQRARDIGSERTRQTADELIDTWNSNLDE